MDWRIISFDWNRVRAFLVTAEEGSLSAAARALGQSQPTLGRQIAALEADLGVALVERVGRGLALTPNGLALLQHARSMGEAATTLSMVASGASTALEGSVRISASELVAGHRLPPIIALLRAAEPALRIVLLATNDISDLRRREADIAVRNTRPTDPSLIARRMPDDTATLYAAPDLIAALDWSRGLESLTVAPFLGFDDSDDMIDALAQRGIGIGRANLAVSCPSHLVHTDLARRGLGIAVLPVWLGDRTPGLQRLPLDLEPFAFPVWLTVHRELRTSRRVRFVFDALAHALSLPPGQEAIRPGQSEAAEG